MPYYAEQVVAIVSAWEGVTVEPHRFGGHEFRLGEVEIGHVHSGGLVDVPFTRAVREHLVAAQRAQPHHILPDTGWISFFMRRPEDVEQAVWLLRLSYLQKRLRRSRSNASERMALIAALDSLEPGPALRALIAS